MPQFAYTKNKDLGEALLRFWTHSLDVQNRCAKVTYKVHKLQEGSKHSTTRYSEQPPALARCQGGLTLSLD